MKQVTPFAIGVIGIVVLGTTLMSLSRVTGQRVDRVVSPKDVSRTATAYPSPPPCLPCWFRTTVDDNFDYLTPPALPPDWLATNIQGPPPIWGSSNSGVPDPAADTLPNAIFVDDPAEVSDKRLDSFTIGFFEGGQVQLTFRQNFNLEASTSDPMLGYDGGVLEISSDGGNTFEDIVAAGGTFTMGGYNRTISSDRGSPIAGRQAWSGNSQGFITTVVEVPAIQKPGRLRWRMASDSTGSGEGWRVDTLELTWCHGEGTPCGTPTPRPSPTPPRPRPRPTPLPRPTPR